MPVLSKKNHQKFVGGFALSGLLWVWEGQHASTGNSVSWSLGHSSRSSFIAGHQNCGIWIDQLDHLPAVMTTSFFLIFSEHPWDKLRANLPHLQFLANNCLYNSHTDINCALIVSIDTRRSLSMKFFIWPINSGVLTSQTSHHPSQTPCLPWISYATQKLVLDSCKMVEKHSEAFNTFLWHFPSLKQNINAYRSSKVFSRPNCILKLTSCNNQALVGCIPIPAVAVH